MQISNHSFFHKEMHARKLADCENRYWQTFLCCALVTAGIFLPYVIIDGGFFHYAGDFNSQQITFYTYMNAFVKEGGTFSWATDLGSGVMNAYSFYLYGSPFFWFTLLFPQGWMPYLMAPMLVLKIAVAGGGAYLYLRRYAKNQNFAIVAACLYAFSGFSIYNVFFNHFIDVVALFPYLLWALDATIYDKKRGWFCVLIALNFINNYFFFVGQVLFICIYFICKVCSGAYRINRSTFAVLATETLLGAGMGMILAWPAFLSLLQNPRTINLSSGYDFLLYRNVQQYFAIFLSWILPPDSPYMSSFWDEGVVRWTSLTAYLPVCSLAAAFAYWKTNKKPWLRRVLAVCMVFALVPVLNSAFYALNASFYARWYYMPILMLALASMTVLEDTAIPLHKSTIKVGILMLSTLAFAFVPVYHEDTDAWTFGELVHTEQYFMVLLLGLFGLALFAWVNEYWRDTPLYAKRLLAVVLAFSFLYGTCHLGLSKFNQWKNDRTLDAQYLGAGKLMEYLPDTNDYRVDTYETQDNLAMWMDLSGLQFFNSTVAPSILSFYPTVNVKRDVSSKPDVDLYALRSLLGVRYTILRPSKEDAFLEENLQGWTRLLEAEGFVVYENENYLPLAFTYDYYIKPESLDSAMMNRKGNLLLRALVLEPEQIEALAEHQITALSALPDEGESLLNYETYLDDVANRRASACDDFEMTNTGLVTNITLPQANLVFLAVPYDDGFTATVNGEIAEIWQVDSGLMAVPCKAGANEIILTYQADGVAESRALFVVSVVLFACYLATLAYFAQKTKKKEIE